MLEKGVHIPPLPQGPKSLPSIRKPSVLPSGEAEFGQILEKTMAGGAKKGLSLSAHASQRLQSRSISLDAEELGKLEKAVDKAAARGCRSSLLIYRDMAFVAGVPSRTIITALDGESMKEHVFTNIDSAVLIE